MEKPVEKENTRVQGPERREETYPSFSRCAPLGRTCWLCPEDSEGGGQENREKEQNKKKPHRTEKCVGPTCETFKIKLAGDQGSERGFGQERVQTPLKTIICTLGMMRGHRRGPGSRPRREKGGSSREIRGGEIFRRQGDTSSGGG